MQTVHNKQVHGKCTVTLVAFGGISSGRETQLPSGSGSGLLVQYPLSGSINVSASIPTTPECSEQSIIK